MEHNLNREINVMTIDCEDWFHGLEIGIESWSKYERRIEGSVNKLLGLFLIACFIICIILLPFINKNIIIRSTIFRPIYGSII